MEFESISGDAENRTTSRGISRRSVMKAGAAAAWSVPLVQVVAAAPAVAASGATLDVSPVTGNFTVGGGSGANEIRMTSISFTVSTTAWTPPATVVATISFTGGLTAPITAPTGWTVAPGNPLTFTKSLIGNEATNTWPESALKFEGKRGSSGPSSISGSVSVTATDPVAGSKTDSSTISLPKA